MIENRASPRVRTLKGGSTIFGVASTVDCVVRNLSETGACLEVLAPLVSPTTSRFKSSRNRKSAIAMSLGAPPTGSAFISNKQASVGVATTDVRFWHKLDVRKVRIQ